MVKVFTDKSCKKRKLDGKNTDVSGQISNIVSMARFIAGDLIVGKYQSGRQVDSPYVWITGAMALELLITSRGELDGFMDLSSKARDFGTAKSEMKVDIICGDTYTPGKTMFSSEKPRFGLDLNGERGVDSHSWTDKTWLVKNDEGKDVPVFIRDFADQNGRPCSNREYAFVIAGSGSQKNVWRLYLCDSFWTAKDVASGTNLDRRDFKQILKDGPSPKPYHNSLQYISPPELEFLRLIYRIVGGANDAGRKSWEAAVPAIDTYHDPDDHLANAINILSIAQDGPAPSLGSLTAFSNARARKTQRKPGLTDIDRIDFMAKGIALQFEDDTSISWWTEGILPRDKPRRPPQDWKAALSLWQKESSALMRSMLSNV